MGRSNTIKLSMKRLFITKGEYFSMSFINSTSGNKIKQKIKMNQIKNPPKIGKICFFPKEENITPRVVKVVRINAFKRIIKNI